MTLQSSGIISLNDIYNEAVASGGYGGGRNIQDLRNESNVKWSPAVPQSPAVIGLNDFYGCQAYQSSSLAPIVLQPKVKNSTGSQIDFRGSDSVQLGVSIEADLWDPTNQEIISVGHVQNTWGPFTGIDPLANGNTFSFSSYGATPTRAFNGNLFLGGLDISTSTPLEWDYAFVRVTVGGSPTQVATYNRVLFGGVYTLRETKYFSSLDGPNISTQSIVVEIELF